MIIGIRPLRLTCSLILVSSGSHLHNPRGGWPSASCWWSSAQAYSWGGWPAVSCLWSRVYSSGDLTGLQPRADDHRHIHEEACIYEMNLHCNFNIELALASTFIPLCAETCSSELNPSAMIMLTSSRFDLNNCNRWCSLTLFISGWPAVSTSTKSLCSRRLAAEPSTPVPWSCGPAVTSISSSGNRGCSITLFIRGSSSSIQLSATGRLLGIMYMCYEFITPLLPGQFKQPKQSDLSVTSPLQSVNRWRYN